MLCYYYLLKIFYDFIQDFMFLHLFIMCIYLDLKRVLYIF